MAFIPSRIKRHKTVTGADKLNLTSMMDMFTIILVFLLKTYTAEGQLIQPSETLSLPKSTIQTSPEMALDLIISSKEIMVGDKPVAALSEVHKQDGFIIEPLQQELQYHAREAKEMEKEYGVSFSGKITIQGDKDLEYKDLVKIMATCGASDYPNMRLVVYQKANNNHLMSQTNQVN